MVVVACQKLSVRCTVVLQLRMTATAAVAVMAACSQSNFMGSTCQVEVSSHVSQVVRSMVVVSRSHMVVMAA